MDGFLEEGVTGPSLGQGKVPGKGPQQQAPELCGGAGPPLWAEALQAPCLPALCLCSQHMLFPGAFLVTLWCWYTGLLFQEPLPLSPPRAASHEHCNSCSHSGPIHLTACFGAWICTLDLGLPVLWPRPRWRAGQRRSGTQSSRSSEEASTLPSGSKWCISSSEMKAEMLMSQRMGGPGSWYQAAGPIPRCGAPGGLDPLRSCLPAWALLRVPRCLSLPR